MRGLIYQLKSVRKDKFCIMSFFLPVVAAIVLNSAGSIYFCSPGELHFAAAMILVAAMFMGCTFNAMSIISEKEDGVAFINEILPMTYRQYVLQKIFIGFAFGCLSASIAAVLCFRLTPAGAAVMLALIVLSAFVSALIGLFLGRISDGLMAGMVYIKIFMIVFMAVPLLRYLAAENKVLSYICCLIPSTAAFEGIMDLADGGMASAGRDVVILSIHCTAWCLLYLLKLKHQKRDM